MIVLEKNTTSTKPEKGLYWKLIGQFVSIIVKLFGHISEVFKTHKVGPEILEWITGDGKQVFKDECLTPLVLRFTQSRPAYKNWPEICKIDDWNLRAALSRVEMFTEMRNKLQRAFPECFTYTAIWSPLPLSVLMAESHEWAQRQRGSHQKWWIDLGIAEHYHIPFTTIYAMDNSDQARRRNLTQLQDGDITEGELEFGEVVTYKGHKYLVIQDDGEECSLAPVERFDLSK